MNTTTATAPPATAGLTLLVKQTWKMEVVDPAALLTAAIATEFEAGDILTAEESAALFATPPQIETFDPELLQSLCEQAVLHLNGCDDAEIAGVNILDDTASVHATDRG